MLKLYFLWQGIFFWGGGGGGKWFLNFFNPQTARRIQVISSMKIITKNK